MLELYYLDGSSFFINPLHIVWIRRTETFTGKTKYIIKLSKSAGVGGRFTFNENNTFFKSQEKQIKKLINGESL